MPDDHFVPAVLLRRWLTAPDNHLVRYGWSKYTHSMMEDRRGTAAICSFRNLNTLSNGRREVEDYLTENIDTPVARVLDAIFERGINSLSSCQREMWAKFIISFFLRSPDTLIDRGADQAQEAIENEFGRPAAHYIDSAVANTTMIGRMRGYRRDMPRQAVVHMLQDPQWWEPLLQMRWLTMPFSDHSMIISDRPVLTIPRSALQNAIPIHDRRCVIILPIRHNQIFVATHRLRNLKNMRNTTKKKLSQLIAEEAIARCRDFVFAADHSLRDDIEPMVRQRFTTVEAAQQAGIAS
jgi:hypothetical protein